MNSIGVVIASGNSHKVDEIRSILQEYAIELHDLSEYEPMPSPEESGTSYQANALLKARHYARLTGAATLADDSGLEIDALQGAPGLHSSRFAGKNTPYEHKIRLILDKLSGLSRGNRSARFRCHAALVTPEGKEYTAEGILEGEIAMEPRGILGFGYDPIFYLPERSLTVAELNPAEKNRISHRARALTKLMTDLGIPRRAINCSTRQQQYRHHT